MHMLPLLPDSSTIIAYRNARPVYRAEFLGEALALAANLPNTHHVMNLCRDRYWFAVSLFAAISRGMLSVLPNSTAAECILALQADIPDLVCLGDQPCPPCDHLPYLQVTQNRASAAPPAMPCIPFDQPVVCVYTSGATGKPQPHLKTFGRMQQSALAMADTLWAATGSPCSVVGTVPFQHMYGLEFTVFLPVFGGGQFSARMPFFPADVVDALAELPAPRLLVTTPFHLHKLIDADSRFPPLALVLSATAPLSPELARAAETRLGAPLLEIYGSTETGQLAMRQPSVQLEWQTCKGITLAQSHGLSSATGGHLEHPQALNDIVELISPTRFRLLGRNSDMINIVGKRSSLAFLNHALTRLPGIQDGVFCLHESHLENEVTRLAAFVVAKGWSSKAIHTALSRHLDPVFLPRPVIFLEALPRDMNGKIPSGAMSKLVTEHLMRKY